MNYSNRFELLFNHLLKDEGGYLPGRVAKKIGDSGGATKYGISIKFLQSCKINEADIDNNGVINESDIVLLSQEQAKKLYYRYFYSDLYDEIKDIQIANRLFNFGVNAGKQRAVRLLQIVLNKHLKMKLLKEDGVFGRKTLTVLNNSEPSIIYDKYVAAIEEFYRQLKKPQFLKGWLDRLRRVLDINMDKIKGFLHIG